MYVSRRTEKITVELGHEDGYIQVHSFYHPNLYVVPLTISAEFDVTEPDWRLAIRAVSITGQRYQQLAARAKPVGPGIRQDPSIPTTWSYSPARPGVPDELMPVLRKIAAYRGIDG